MAYVVGVLCPIGRKSAMGIAQITDDSITAIRTARDIENLGYELRGEVGVFVYKIKPYQKYPKGSFEYSDGQPPKNFPVVFMRTKMNGKWIERWFDIELQREVEPVFAQA